VQSDTTAEPYQQLMRPAEISIEVGVVRRGLRSRVD
jgi:hypothetical protein